MRLRIDLTIAMLEIRNRKTLQSKVNICKSDVKIGDYVDSLTTVLRNVCIKDKVYINCNRVRCRQFHIRSEITNLYTRVRIIIF